MNILPHQGTVEYYGNIIPNAAEYLQHLLTTIHWQQDEIWMFGKKIITKRKVAWYGSKPFTYTYSKTTKTALPFNAILQQLKTIAEQATSATYNSCLLNLYHTGTEGMGWHADDEKELLHHGAIATISFGAVRKIAFKHKADNTKVDVVLEHGSILLMKNETQTHWLHSIPATKKITDPRVSLTFRTIVEK